jgi:hypothetical protein
MKLTGKEAFQHTSFVCNMCRNKVKALHMVFSQQLASKKQINKQRRKKLDSKHMFMHEKQAKLIEICFEFEFEFIYIP